MSSFLDKLQRVRSLREQLAQFYLAQGRNQLNQADEKLSRKWMHLEHHRLIKSKQEALLFNAIDGQELSLNEFDDYCTRISDLRTEEQYYLERVRQAKFQMDSARAEVDRLSAVLQKRCRECAKLKEFCRAWNAKVEEEKEWWRQEEMEEVVGNRSSYNDIPKG